MQTQHKIVQCEQSHFYSFKIKTLQLYISLIMSASILLNSLELLETFSTRVLNNTTITQQIVSQMREQNLLPTSETPENTPLDIPAIVTAITTDATAQETLSTAVVSDISENETLKNSLSTAIVAVLSTDSEVSQTLSTAVVNTVNNTTALKDSLATSVVNTITADADSKDELATSVVATISSDSSLQTTLSTDVVNTIEKDDTLIATLRGPTSTGFSNVIHAAIYDGYYPTAELIASSVGTLYLFTLHHNSVGASDITITINADRELPVGFFFFLKRSNFNSTSTLLNIHDGNLNGIFRLRLPQNSLGIVGEAEPLHIFYRSATDWLNF